MTDLDAAVAKHGALAVYRAIYRAMGGDHRALLSMGFDHLTLQALYAMSIAAHGMLTPEERVANEADVAIGMAKLPRGGA